MEIMITIPCEYQHPQGRACEEGRVLVYGEHGGPPPEINTCPQCKGAGVIQVERSKIEGEIEDLCEELNDIYDRIRTLKGYLAR